MSERVKAYGRDITITREEDYLYFTKGDPISIYRTKMQHKGRTKSKQISMLVLKTPIVRNNDFIYYISSDNYLTRIKRGRK